MSFQSYADYKATGEHLLGEIPKHWLLSRFKQILQERGSRSTTGKETLLSVSAYTGVSRREDVVEEGEFLTRADSLEGYKLCQKNDLVINIMLAWNRALAVTPLDGIVSPAYCVFQVTSPLLNPQFLNYLVRTDQYSLYFKAYSTGVIDSRLRLYPDTFGRLKCWIPPMIEQKAILAFLDEETSKIDALVAEQRRLIELLKEKRQAVISHAVTKGLNPHVKMKPSGIDWLGDVPEHWKVPPVFARYSCVLGKMLDERKQSGDFGLPYLRNADVNWDRINIDGLPLIDIKPEEYDRFTLQNGDILICEGGAGIGQTAIWQGGLELCAFQKALHRLRPWKEELENPRFFYYCMSYFVHSGIALRGGTATIPHLTGEQLRKYRLPRPPKSEQDAIVDFLDLQTKRFIQLEDDAGVAISLLQERRTALISAAVTGKIDVRGFVKKGKQNAALCP